MDALPLPLLIVLIVVAVLVGLWAGGRANREVKSRSRESVPWGARIRGMAGKGALSVFRWNQKRKRKKAARERDDER
ncbi:MAG: hypothetical protein AAGA54_20510 [Myxococcota bacterium]